LVQHRQSQPVPCFLTLQITHSCLDVPASISTLVALLTHKLGSGAT
jgi:hypothetical protein